MALPTASFPPGPSGDRSEPVPLPAAAAPQLDSGTPPCPSGHSALRCLVSAPSRGKGLRGKGCWEELSWSQGTRQKEEEVGRAPGCNFSASSWTKGPLWGFSARHPPADSRALCVRRPGQGGARVCLCHEWVHPGVCVLSRTSVCALPFSDLPGHRPRTEDLRRAPSLQLQLFSGKLRAAVRPSPSHPFLLQLFSRPPTRRSSAPACR